MRKTIAIVAAAAALAGAQTASAQSALPVSFEARLDAGVPTGDAGDAFNTGVGFGLRASLDLAPTFSIYGGYSRFSFDLKDSGLTDAEAELDGFEVGGRVSLGTGAGVATPYALLGALFHNDQTGLEAGLGADYPVSYNLSVTPEVRYRTVDEFNYISLGIGARVHF
ncbi:MAG TPA: outer membrane beta-barrel protein [Longimicrobium sp.]|uniref:outer membrane beta-barrel protein n=1 Tax=Longimicrobium sp. TaxID=2029185 RepID=UPI002ED80663